MSILSVSPMIYACPAVSEQALAICEVSKIYDRQIVVDKVSLTVPAGEIFGLLGPNGAGKTTLMKMIAGLSRPSAGVIKIFGIDAVKERLLVKPFLGMVPQDNNLERELSVREALLVYARLYGLADIKKRVGEVMTELDLAGFGDKKVGQLSGGMARRVLIARSLLPEPRILLLDEPTVGLDPDVRQEIWLIVRQLAQKGITIFMTTHYMEEAEQLCQRIALLKAGRILVVESPERIKNIAKDQGDDNEVTLEKAFLRLIRGGAV